MMVTLMMITIYDIYICNTMILRRITTTKMIFGLSKERKREEPLSLHSYTHKKGKETDHLRHEGLFKK